MLSAFVRIFPVERHNKNSRMLVLIQGSGVYCAVSNECHLIEPNRFLFGPPKAPESKLLDQHQFAKIRNVESAPSSSNTVVSRVSIAVIKHHHQRQLGDKGFGLHVLVTVYHR